MLQVLSSAWALLLGIGLLMVGNGLQGTLLGVRGEIEGFSTFEMSLVMSAYFIGFLGGSRLAPEMIRRVGHVRVFAALASFISAVMILYPVLPNTWVWIAGRIIIGFCFSGVYVTAESWLNNAADNSNRGKALSLYMIVQMIGIITAQALIQVGNPGGYEAFVIASILVSISFGPILLSISPTPAFDTAKPMSLREIMRISPLGCVGMFILGGIFSAQFGMSAVYGASVGMSLTNLSIFVVALCGGIGSIVGFLFGGDFKFLLVAAFLIGGLSNPLYSLLIAYTNDYLDHDDMAAASGGVVFINGLGAIAGPMITGWLMEDGVFGPPGFFLFIAALMFAMAVYAAYRATQRASVPVEETGTMSPMSPTASPVAVEWAQEVAIEADLEAQEGDETT
jgi:MFS family permease